MNATRFTLEVTAGGQIRLPKCKYSSKKVGRLNNRTLAPLAVGLTLLLVGCVSAQPTMPPPPELSEAERQALVEQTLDDQWTYVSGSFPDAVRPSVDVVRFTTLEDQTAVLVECLNEAGFAATQNESGQGIEFEGIEAQAESYAMAYYTCQAEYPLDPLFRVPFTNAELEYLYYYTTGELTECVESHGYETTAPPSLQSFVESYEQGAAWSPFEAVVGLSQSEFDELRRACSQIPPGFRTG